MEAALSPNLCLQVQRVVRQVVALRSDQITSATGGAAIQEFDPYFDACIEDEAPSPPLSKDSTRLEAVQSVLEAAYQIQCLTQSFLETHLERANSLRPSHLLDPNFRYSNTPLCDHPMGRNYEPDTNDAPSWIEEQRVYRALWRIQLYYDFVKYSKKQDDPCDDVRTTLHLKGPRRVWGRLLSWELDEMGCVYEYLNDIRSPKETLKLPSIKHSDIRRMPQRIPEDTESDYIWCQCTDALENPSMGFYFFHKHASRMPTSPMYVESFAPFRRVGFGIWDLKRMFGLGMLNVPVKIEPYVNFDGYLPGLENRLSSDNLYFTWSSIVHCLPNNQPIMR